MQYAVAIKKGVCVQLIRSTTTQ